MGEGVRRTKNMLNLSYREQVEEGVSGWLGDIYNPSEQGEFPFLSLNLNDLESICFP